MKDFIRSCGDVIQVEATIVFWMTVVFVLSSLAALVF